MKTICIQKPFASLVIAMLLLLNISSALAGGLHGPEAGKNKFRSHVEVAFTKWLAGWPNMAGLVSGDAGGGHFVGEVLNFEHTEAVDKIEALYHINGGAFQFTAQLYNSRQPEGHSRDPGHRHGWAAEGRASAWRIPGDQPLRCN
jgi:hypothetical protein